MNESNTATTESQASKAMSYVQQTYPSLVNGHTLQDLSDLLAEPFPLELLSWKPQAIAKGNGGDVRNAVAATYADPRAYIDRLNEVVGPAGWSDQYETSIATGFMKVKTGWGDKPDTITGPHAKVFVVCRLTIEGLGTKSDGGESTADDENALTSALSQAFKRACAKFGLGRYLYDLPKDVWCPYDTKKKRFVETPPMPEWALPAPRCEECHQKIYSMKVNDKVYAGSQVVENSMKKYKKALCGACSLKAAEAQKAAANRKIQ